MKTIGGLVGLLPKAWSLMESKINSTTVDEHPILFYATTEKCERGNILLVSADTDHPEFFVCHPLDIDEMKEKITGRELKPLDIYIITLDWILKKEDFA